MSFRTTGVKPGVPLSPLSAVCSAMRRATPGQWLANLGMVGLLCAATTVLAQSDAVTALTEQANYWQGLGRSDLAEENWQKLLRVSPQSADGLYGMAQVEMSRGNAEGSRLWIDRLRTSHPDDARTARLEKQSSQSGAPASDLQRARSAAQAGRPADAVQLYRAMFNNRPPQEALALEYYEVLGGTPQGYDEARKGLEQLAKDRPGNSDPRLALAKLLTYREPTRREGIRQLAEMTKQPGMATRTRAPWRQALIWLDARAPDAPLYTEYLAGQADSAVSARLETITASRTSPTVASSATTAVPAASMTPVATPAPVLPRALPLGEGFKALDQGDTATAEQRFQQALHIRPNDRDALGGMGLIRLREQKFAVAQDLLQRASKGSGQRWTTALRSASYWNLIDQANAARDKSDARTARTLLTRAVQLDPREPVGQNALADLRLAAGEFASAEQGYQRVLEAKPADVQALRGLITAYTRQGKIADAQALTQKLTPEQSGAMGVAGGLRDVQVEMARAQARAQNDAGDPGSAQRTLEDAMLTSPDSPWVRLDLANIYRRNGLTTQARGVMDGLLMSQPDMPDALYASAMLAADASDPTAGLQYLDRIPATARTRDMAQLQRRLWAQGQVQRALALGRQGRGGEARNVLAQTEAALGSDVPADLWGQLAGGYAEIGDSPRALAMSRQLFSRMTNPSTGDRLLYASVLLKTRQDVELSAVLRQLQTLTMSASQRTDFDSLRVAYTLRQADALREAGNLEGAYNVMGPLVAERPEDPKALATMARLYTTARDERQALLLYRRILQRTPDDLGTLLSAASSASAVREHAEAQAFIATALKQAPEQSTVLAAAGRIYRNAGDNTRAEQYLRAALTADARAVGGLAATPAQGGGMSSTSGNPFAGMTGGAVGMAMPVVMLAPSPSPAGFSRTENSTGMLAGMPWAGSFPVTAPTEKPSAPTRDGAAGRTVLNTASSTGAIVPAYQAVASAYPFPPPATNPFAASSQMARGGLPEDSGWNTQRRANGAPVDPVLAELQDLVAERSMTLSAGTVFRNRAGEAGLSQLSDMQIPIEARIPVGKGKIVVSATPTFLDAGTVASDYGVSSRFGAGPSAALAQSRGSLAAPAGQYASGVGLSVGYEGKNVNASIGTTPLGFPVTNVIGNLALNGALSDNVTIKADLSRRAVTDSLLSFAGTKDTRTNESFGGVVATGGRVDLNRDDGTYGLYGYGSFHQITGRNVADNNRTEAGGGLYVHLMRNAGSSLTAGMNLGILHYNQNLSYYTIGQGGYFSPQRQMSLAFPVSWTSREDRLSWGLNGSLGVQSFTQNASPYFPTNPARQAAAANAAATALGMNLNNLPFTGAYAASTKTGLAYNLGGSIEYQVAPQLYLGGALSLNNAQNFRQATGSIHLRYMLDGVSEFGRSAGSGATLRPFSSPYTPML